MRPKRSGERVRSIRRAQAGEADTKRPNCAIRNPVKCQFLGRRAIRRPPVSVPRSEPLGPGVGRADLIADLVRAAEERLVSLGESGLGESRPHPKLPASDQGRILQRFLAGNAGQSLKPLPVVRRFACGEHGARVSVANVTRPAPARLSLRPMAESGRPYEGSRGCGSRCKPDLRGSAC